MSIENIRARRLLAVMFCLMSGVGSLGEQAMASVGEPLSSPRQPMRQCGPEWDDGEGAVDAAAAVRAMAICSRAATARSLHVVSCRPFLDGGRLCANLVSCAPKEPETCVGEVHCEQE